MIKNNTITVDNKKVGAAAGVVAVILSAVFAVEGGYVNDKNDPGGETNHGITKQVAIQHGYTAPMKAMTKEVAANIYYEDYIVKPGFKPMIDLAPAVAEELVDSGVNTGTGRPSLWFQESLNSLNRGGKDYKVIVVDGKIGANSINAYQELQRVRGKVKACQLMIKLLDAKQATYYVSLKHLNIYTPGWIDNRVGNVPLSKCTTYTGSLNVPVNINP